MFDYIYSDIKDRTVKEIISLPFLDFVAPISTSTGEINPFNRERNKTLYTPKNQLKADYKGLTIVVTNDRYVNLQGSLHECYHGQNRGDFTSAEVLKVITEISSALSINPFLTTLHNLEFGVNIILPFKVDIFLDSILCYKGKRPDRITYSGNGYLIKFFFKQYEVKLYDKGKQHGLNCNILRVEIKVRRMQFLHAKGLLFKSLLDLLNVNYYPGLNKILISTINSVVLFDRDIDKTKMSKNEKRIFSECSNPYYWNTLWNDNQTKYRKRLIQFRTLNERYGKSKIHSTALRLVSKKWYELTGKTDTDITGLPEESSTDITAGIKDQKQITGTNITVQITGNIRTPLLEIRKCKYCKRDISNQKPESLFCSERLYGAEGKKCRNRKSNFIKREKKKMSIGNYIFDPSTLLQNDFYKEIAMKEVK